MDSQQETRDLTPDDTLFVAHPKRVLHSRETAEDGTVSLNIVYGEIEISFDDPVFIPFGEKLLGSPRFRAGDATAWTSALGEWDAVKEVLATLVQQGYLEVDVPVPAGCPFHAKKKAAAEVAVAPPPPPPVVYATSPRTFDPERCAELSKEIFGLEVETSNIESLMRANRLAHSALDATGRQLGDENCYPPQLQLHMETEYRACPYTGSRNQQERPMNVTALKLVTSVWTEVIDALHATKKEMLRRRGSDAPFSLVDIYVYGTVVLSLPSYQLHRPTNRVKNGDVTATLSAIYRAIDGTRLTSRAMMMPRPKAKPGASVPSLDEFLHFTEKEFLFFTPMRVCSGPPQMVRELVGTAIAPSYDEAKATPIAGLEKDLPTAFDYALLGCEIETWFDLFWMWQGELVDAFRAKVEALGKTAETASLLESLAAIRRGNSTHLGTSLSVPGSDRPTVVSSMLAIVETCRRLRGDATPAPRFEAPGGTEAADREWAAHLSPELAEAVAAFVASIAALEDAVIPQMQAAQRALNQVMDRKESERRVGAADYARTFPESSARAVLASWLGVAWTGEGKAATLRSVRTALPEPQILDEAQMATLRRLFVRTRYSLPTVLWALAGNRSFDTELDASRRFEEATRSARASTAPSASALELLARLFLFGKAVPARETELLAPAEVDALRKSGLLVLDEETRTVSAPFAVGSVNGIYFLTDTAQTIAKCSGAKGAGPNELVMPAYNETYFFAAKVDRGPVESALDLCTGGGIHALLAARHAKRVLGVDISARATRLAEWSRVLNGITNVTFVSGSVWGPVPEETFDRITVNPPYQPDSSAQPGENWWGAGPRGDGVIAEILTGLPRYLAEGGVFHMVGDFLSWEDRPFEAFVRAQLGVKSAEVALDTEERALSAYRARYPKERLPGLTRAEYGVVTVCGISR